MAYTLLDLTTAVQDDLHDPSFSSTRIVRYLNHGQRVIFNTHQFKFCEKSVSGTLTVGKYAYLQQADHQTTIGGVLIDPVTTTRRVTLDQDTYLPSREFFAEYPDPSTAANAQPAYWTEYGNQIYFNVPADKVYTFRQRYFRVPTDMVATTDVPDVPVSFRELLELYADYRSEKYRGNHDVAATYKQDFEDGLEAMNLRYAGVTQIGPTTMRQTRSRIYE